MFRWASSTTMRAFGVRSHDCCARRGCCRSPMHPPKTSARIRSGHGLIASCSTFSCSEYPGSTCKNNLRPRASLGRFSSSPLTTIPGRARRRWPAGAPGASVVLIPVGVDDGRLPLFRHYSNLYPVAWRLVVAVDRAAVLGRPFELRTAIVVRRVLELLLVQIDQIAALLRVVF